MTTEQQKTFGDIVGMESTVPVGPHRDDIIECSDGTTCRREDAIVDCWGRFHSTDESRLEADTEIIHDIIDNVCKAAEEYTEHDDYGDMYHCCAWESITGDDLYDKVREWMEDNCYHTIPAVVLDWLAQSVAVNLYESNTEAEHDRNEYAAYNGSGICIGSFEVGECEEQLDLSAFEEFSRIHGFDLEVILDAYIGDAFLYCHDRYDKTAGKRIKIGYINGNCLTYYTNPGGQWHIIFSAESIKNAIGSVCEELVSAYS